MKVRVQGNGTRCIALQARKAGVSFLGLYGSLPLPKDQLTLNTAVSLFGPGSKLSYNLHPPNPLLQQLPIALTQSGQYWHARYTIQIGSILK